MNQAQTAFEFGEFLDQGFDNGVLENRGVQFHNFLAAGAFDFVAAHEQFATAGAADIECIRVGGGGLSVMENQRAFVRMAIGRVPVMRVPV